MRGDGSVCARIRKFSPRFSKASDSAILAASSAIDAIDVVSREHGFRSWHAAQEADVGHKLLSLDASQEHLKKQAKKLLKAYQVGDGVAVERARVHYDGEQLTLNDAQFVLAREYGYASWPRMMANFQQPDHPGVNRPQLFAIERMHDECVRQLAETFSRHLGEKAVCDTAFIDQTTYSEFIHSLAVPSCLCSFSVEAMGCRSVLDIAMPLVFALLGKGDDDERWLTEEERGRMEPVFGDVLTGLQRSWESVLPTVVGSIEIGTDPQLIKVAEEAAIIVLIAFEVNTLENSGLVSIAYPLLYELRDHFERKS